MTRKVHSEYLNIWAAAYVSTLRQAAIMQRDKVANPVIMGKSLGAPDEIDEFCSGQFKHTTYDIGHHACGPSES